MTLKGDAAWVEDNLVHAFLRRSMQAMAEGTHTDWLDPLFTPDVEVHCTAPPGLGYPLGRVQGAEVVKACFWLANMSGNRHLVSYEMIRGGRCWAEFRIVGRILSTGKTLEAREGMAVTLRGGRIASVYRLIDWKSVIESTTLPDERFEAVRPVLQCAPPGKPSWERPCAHNDWDNCRAKRNWAQLRCRTCGSLWRLPEPRPDDLVVCAAFREGCCYRGEACPRPHIHSRKQPPEERVNTAALPPAAPWQPSAAAPPAAEDPPTSPRPTFHARVWSRIFSLVPVPAAGSIAHCWPPPDPADDDRYRADAGAFLQLLHSEQSPDSESLPPLLSEMEFADNPEQGTAPPAPAAGLASCDAHRLRAVEAFAAVRGEWRRGRAADDQVFAHLADDATFSAPHCNLQGKQAIKAALCRASGRVIKASGFAPTADPHAFARHLDVHMTVVTFKLREVCTVNEAGLISGIAMAPARG